MRRLSNEEFLKLVEAGNETPNREFKSPFSWKNRQTWRLKEKVIKTILSFANTKDGGDILIGVKDDANAPDRFCGLSSTQLNSFSDYDSLKGIIDGFASPTVRFDVVEGHILAKKFVVIHVSEFDDIPVICRKDGGDRGAILRKGDIYARSKSGQPSTVKVTDLELREIIEMAVTKYVNKLGKIGILGGGRLRSLLAEVSRRFRMHQDD